jgi:hypothetical protein
MGRRGIFFFHHGGLPKAVLVAGILGLLTGLLSVDEIPMRMAKIEWLPMGSYYHAEPRGALFDLAKKLFCWGGLVFLSPDLKAQEMQEDGNVWPFLSV